MTIWTEQQIIALRQRTATVRTQVINEPVMVDLDDTASALLAAQVHAAAAYEAGLQQGAEAGYSAEYDPREGPDVEV